MTWELLHKDPKGHKLFLDQSDGSYKSPWPRIYVADNSGFTPDQTEDGVLEIDQNKVDKVVFTPSYDGQSLICYVPVLMEGKAGYTVGLSNGCARVLAERWGLRMFIDAPYLTNPIQIESKDLV